jgi:thiol:disulfide interchange protein DsbD
MSVRTMRFFKLVGLLMCTAMVFAQAEESEFLPPEQAFSFSATQRDAHTVHLHWSIAPGYHLYRDRINVTADADASPLPLTLPSARSEFDAVFGKSVMIYLNTLDVDLLMDPGSATVTWQGCADGGLCYAPASATVKLDGAGPAHTARGPQASGRSRATGSTGTTGTDAIGAVLASGSLWRTLGVFWIAGLLLSFTPCVLPMVPILSSLIAGQGASVTRLKGLQLALGYAFGMALVYAGFGVAAGLAGEGLAAALQNPWVLGCFALLLSTLAMSMFGFYELQVPAAVQSRASEWANRFRGGNLVGVFIMGGISALVVGPCVAAPLAGALVYISQTRDVVLGGLALFSMALGMSVPLLLVGVSAGSLLPRAGAWMEQVKRVFGMMLLGVAIWMVSPVLPVAVPMLLWAGWLLTGAGLLGLFAARNAAAPRSPVAARAGGAVLASLALLLLIGAASGGQSVLQPLAHLSGARGAAVAGAPPGLPFERITDGAALDAALLSAQKQGQTVMLDFYADWCVACKEFESTTFSDAIVRGRLAKVRLLQVDVTSNSAGDRELLKRFGLFGPPGIVFFDGLASARVSHKVVGYQGTGDFLASLAQASIP